MRLKHAALILSFWMMVFILSGCGESESVEEKQQRIYFTDYTSNNGGYDVIHDRTTGCQYLTRSQGGITPLLKPDGKPLCTDGSGDVKK